MTSVYEAAREILDELFFVSDLLGVWIVSEEVVQKVLDSLCLSLLLLLFVLFYSKPLH